MVVIVLLLIGAYFYGDSKLNGIPRVAVTGLTPPQSGQPLDVLLVGSDSRACVSPAQAKAVGSAAEVAGQRSDVIIVARFLAGGRVEMLSIPRDTWVPIAGTNGSAKINAAFNTGPSQLVATIQHNFHIPINHVVMTNFCSFPAMVNALGGIYLNFPDPVYDLYSGLDIRHTGCQLVNGTEALALVRSRHLNYYSGGHWNYDGMSDFSRIQRQQAFFHALLERVHSAVFDVFRLNSFVGATLSGLQVDSSFSPSAMMALGWGYHSVNTSSLTTSVLPTTESVIDSEDVLLPAPVQDRSVIQAFLVGNTSTFTASLGVAHEGAGFVPGSDDRSVATGDRSGQAIFSLASSIVIMGHLNEPWNPVPC